MGSFLTTMNADVQNQKSRHLPRCNAAYLFFFFMQPEKNFQLPEIYPSTEVLFASVMFFIRTRMRSNPLFSLLQSGDQKGELVATTVCDYDLSEIWPLAFSEGCRPHSATSMDFRRAYGNVRCRNSYVPFLFHLFYSTHDLPPAPLRIHGYCHDGRHVLLLPLRSPCSSSPSWESRTSPNPLLSTSSVNLLSATSNAHLKPLVYSV
jgi:hypothetical protein